MVQLSSNTHKTSADVQLEAERFIQSALDALSAHVAILDGRSEIINVNAAWRKFAYDNGFSDLTYGIGSNYLAVCDAAAKRKSKDAARVARGIRDILEGTHSQFELEYACHGPNERRWFVVRISRFDWYRDVRLIVVHQNVSELKNVQVELTSSKSRLEAILDNINNGILTINSRGIVETANRAAARIFGYPMDGLIGTPLERLIDQPFSDELLNKHVNSEYGEEITGQRKDGSHFPIYFALSELKLDGSSIYTCIIRDITYRKRMEAEIIKRERIQVALEKEREVRTLKTRFLSMMSHELNTPLAAISLSYDMLKKYSHVATVEENEQALDNIRQQVEYLRDMVNDVMTLSRSEIEGLTIDPEEVDLITYCRDVVEEFTFTYHRTHEVKFECKERDIRAQIDRRMLRRVFTNLLSNAIKYSPDGGRVVFRLSVKRKKKVAMVEVIDSGIGIPLEDQPHLFEPFHRAGNVDKLPGTGLGLAIVKQVVELHKGVIAFESAPNQGTHFIITLPLHHDR